MMADRISNEEMMKTVIEITDLNHVSIIVKDVETSKRFYCDILGMEEAPRPPNFDFEGAWFRKGGAEIHLVQANEAVQPAGDAPANPTQQRDLTFARHMSFGVNDINKAIRTLEENQVPIVKGPRPRGDVAVKLYCHDPDGHLIELTAKENQ